MLSVVFSLKSVLLGCSCGIIIRSCTNADSIYSAAIHIAGNLIDYDVCIFSFIKCSTRGTVLVYHL